MTGFDEKWIKEYCRKNGFVQQGNQIVRPSAASPVDGAKRKALPCVPAAPSGVSVADMDKPAKRPKYGNEKTTNEDGEVFDSKHEAKCYEMLRLECLAGQHVALARQVIFYLPGGVKYIADFVTQEPDGTSTVYDAKSEATKKNAAYRLKKRLMENCLHIRIKEI